MGYICPLCGQVIQGGDSSLLWHLRNIHNAIAGHTFITSILCKQDGCQRSFSGYISSYRKHLISSHPVQEMPALHHHTDAQVVHDVDIMDNDSDDDDNGENNFDVDVDVDTLDEGDIEDKAAMIVAELLASSSTVQSTVTRVTSNVGDLMGDVVAFLRQKTTEFVNKSGIPLNEDFQTLMENFESVSNPFSNLTTCYQQKKYFDNSQFFVKPESISLGIGFFPCKNRKTGNVMQAAKKITFQYIPVKELLKVVMKQEDFWAIVLKHKPSQDGIMRDFHDGHFCKSNDILSSTTTVKLILYIDDFEVTNPLSPRAGDHKLGAVYFSIANVPPKQRSSLSNIFLTLLFNSGDAKMYGYSAIFSQFIKDMKSLGTDGIDVETNTFSGNIKVVIAQVVGDNLGINSLFGFASGFTANYYCRSCKMVRGDTRRATREDRNCLRTREIMKWIV